MAIMSEKDFEQVYEIMEEAFPKAERRPKELQKKLLENYRYRLELCKDDDGRVIGFLAFWIFDDFCFLEHLAVRKSSRGQKIGERMLKRFFETLDKPLFFEVEAPVTELAKRRVEFYKRLGCAYNSFGYMQPTLWEGEKSVELRIMSYPHRLDQSLFESWKEQVFNEVYCKL